MQARVRAAACVASLVVFGMPRAAEAAPVLRIEWPTVPGCPDASVVLARARAALGQSKDVEDVGAVAEITPPAKQGGPWLLHIRTRTVRAAGERTLEVPSCDAVARTAALLVALAALRSRAPAEEHAIEELVPAPDRVDESSAPAPPMPLRKRAREEPTALSPAAPDGRFAPSVELGVAIGLLPRPAPMTSAMLAYERSSFRIRLGVRALLPQQTIDRGVGAELTALGASLDACGRLPLPLPFRGCPHACAGATADDIRASGIGGVEAFDVRRSTVMAFGGAGAEWHLGRTFRLGADARVGASLVRPGFVIDAGEAHRLLHRPDTVRAEAALTFGFVF
jgi:hypothetical protein